MKTNSNTTPVWLITGCSTGFGRSPAEYVLERGHRLVATARKPELLKELAERGDTLILPLDVTDTTQIAATIQAAEDRFGRYRLEGDPHRIRERHRLHCDGDFRDGVLYQAGMTLYREDKR